MRTPSLHALHHPGATKRQGLRVRVMYVRVGVSA